MNELPLILVVDPGGRVISSRVVSEEDLQHSAKETSHWNYFFAVEPDGFHEVPEQDVMLVNNFGAIRLVNEKDAIDHNHPAFCKQCIFFFVELSTEGF